MKRILTLTTLLVFLFSGISFSQQSLTKIDKKLKTVLKPTVKYAKYSDVSKPLRDMKPVPGWSKRGKVKNEEVPIFKLTRNDNPFENTKNQNPNIQKEYSASKATLNIGTNVDGVQGTDGYGVVPPDPHGDVGLTYYMQMVNNGTEIFNKSTGASVLGPFDSSTFWDSFSGDWNGTNDGDPIVMYDEQADRWIVTQFAVTTSAGTYWELIAVSTSNDPTGTYYRYAFEFPEMDDYPKLGIFLDSYVLTVNSFDSGGSFTGTYVSALDRTALLAGPDNATPSMIQFFDPVGGPFIASEFSFTWLPADIEGALPPTGTDIPFVFDMADETYWTKDALVVAEMHVDWGTPANSTFTLSNEISITQDTDPGSDAPQPSNAAEGLDLLNDRMMTRAQFRHFATYDAMVLTRTVDDGTSKAGIRWYELRNSGTGWSIYQQGTYAPADGVWRWMPVIAMNGNGDIAIAYATSDATSVEPSMRATARYAGDPLNTMTATETVLYGGNTSQDASTYTRWGDYFSLMVDPSDDYTFWFTGEYSDGGWDWVTRIIEFALPVTSPPTVTGISPATLYEDRGKQLTITGTNLTGCSFDIGGITGTATSNDGSTAIVNFPPGNYANGTLTAANAAGSDTYSVTVSTRNTIPVVSGAGVTDDNHPTIQSAIDGLAAWYGTTSFGAGDLAGTKTIEVATGTYAEEVTLNTSLAPDASNLLVIQPASGAIVEIDATGNNYGFNLSTLDYVTLKGFTVHGADSDNIYAQGNNVTISYNKTYGSVKASGIKIETGTPFTVTNNLSYGNYKHGIHINNSSNNIIKNNTADDNGGLVSPQSGVEIFNDPFTDLSNWVAGNWGLYTGISGSPSGDPFAGVEGNGAYQAMTSNAIDVTGYNNLTISCYYGTYGTLEPTDDIIGEYSFDGSTWTTLFTASNDITPWVQASATGVTPTSNTLYIRFNADVDATEYWLIDDVVVTGDETFTAYNEGNGIYVQSGTGSAVENNIFVAKAGSNSYYALKSETGVTANSDYNVYYTTNTNLFDYNGTQDNTGPMSANDQNADPDFVNTGTDYHTKSQADSYAGGEWPPLTASAGTWTTDASTSPAIDAGNTADAFANEPSPNGSRINAGAYGNTVQASKTFAVVCTYPSAQATNFALTTANTNDLTVSWTRGTGGDAVIVLVKEGSAVDSDPVDGTSYTANTAFGSGTQIGTGNYVVSDASTTSVTVTGLTASTTYYFAIYEYNATGNCYLIPALTGNATTAAPVTYNWTGAANDNNWFNTANWSSSLVPGSSNDVTIPNVTYQPIINQGISSIAQCNNLTIDAGADITIDVNGYMTVNGSITNNTGNTGLVINSDDTGSGSLIQNTSGGVDATVYRKLSSAGRQWHMVSSPITAAPFSVFSSSTYLFEYDETVNDSWSGSSYDTGSADPWATVSGNMAVSKGYIYNNFAETLTFAGQLNDNTASSAINVSYTTANGDNNFDGWNLIGNPYTSAIDWDNAAVAHAAANLDDAIYTYDDTNLHNYTSYVGGTGTNGGTQYIPAGQGFFVNASASGTLNIGAAARVHNAQGFWKSAYETPNNFLRLQVSANPFNDDREYTDETVIRFSDNATNDVDKSYDAYKLFSMENYVPQIYTNLNGTGYSINTLKTVNEGTVSLPLKVEQIDGDYKISVTEFNFNGFNVYLKDNLKNTTTEIGLNDVINLTSDESDKDGRFELVFEKSTSGIILAENSNVTLYPNPNGGLFYLTVSNNPKDYRVVITTITGQVIYKNKFNGNTSKIIKLANQNSGIYFVKIIFSDNSSIIKKIVKE